VANKILGMLRTPCTPLVMVLDVFNHFFKSSFLGVFCLGLANVEFDGTKNVSIYFQLDFNLNCMMVIYIKRLYKSYWS